MKLKKDAVTVTTITINNFQLFYFFQNGEEYTEEVFTDPNTGKKL